jgi:hypothetical protein
LSPNRPSPNAENLDFPQEFDSQRGKTATELREAFGVRGACSRFPTTPALRQRQQAGRTPNASRGRSINFVDFYLTAAQSLTHDAATLQLGGWEIQADSHTPVGPLPQPQNLHVTGGDLDGSVDLGWDAIKRGVQTYIAERATAADGPYTQCYIGKPSSCTDTGLVSGTEYWYRVRALGAAGPSAWSDPATKRAT